MFNKRIPATIPTLTETQISEKIAANDSTQDQANTFYVNGDLVKTMSKVAFAAFVALGLGSKYQFIKQSDIIDSQKVASFSEASFQELQLTNKAIRSALAERNSIIDITKWYQSAESLNRYVDATKLEMQGASLHATIKFVNSNPTQSNKISEASIASAIKKQSLASKLLDVSLWWLAFIWWMALLSPFKEAPKQQTNKSKNTPGRRKNYIQDGEKVIQFEPKIVGETWEENETYADFRDLPGNKTPIVIPAIATSATINLPKPVPTATSQPTIQPTATEIESQPPKVPLIKRETEIQENIKKIHLCAFEAMLQISWVDNTSVIEFVNRLKDTDIDLNDVINPGSNYEDMFSLYIIYSLWKTPQQIPVDKMRWIDQLINEFKKGLLKHSSLDSKLSEIIWKMPIAA